ncbi:MAG: hypothetical protein A3D44_03080 [Candidatus Staskawiczbacteria bacterium RIFCSPHIGHO2_02_FULL_42_22]|uniref:N-acetyltransferase domain-containing protein n=1 Tax=Candidatus Staskawiczbacteria bacterium RIFCSPHIGHO2_02_FULL_42_22 TaxID=1802207 RepID=A0A1G2I4X1_9BACT|nr:MAG: hypothetical protein A3D44_03080 [Candidatus Staskawiczbacteria bacterium RIFCSPHIGHO2_02_FULL_42_22]
MIICLAEKNDALAMAQIHKTEINKGFLSSLNISFLKNLYEAIILSSASFCVVAKEGDQVTGFISGVTSIKKLYRYFFAHYFLSSSTVLFKKLFSLSFIKKVFETLLYSSKEQSLPSAELLTMAVKQQFQGKGIASQMLFTFLAEMKKRNIQQFKVLVGEELAPAIHFYEKNGFTFFKNTTVHQGKSSRVYIYKMVN